MEVQVIKAMEIVRMVFKPFGFLALVAWALSSFVFAVTPEKDAAENTFVEPPCPKLLQPNAKAPTMAKSPTLAELQDIIANDPQKIVRVVDSRLGLIDVVAVNPRSDSIEYRPYLRTQSPSVNLGPMASRTFYVLGTDESYRLWTARAHQRFNHNLVPLYFALFALENRFQPSNKSIG